MKDNILGEILTSGTIKNEYKAKDDQYFKDLEVIIKSRQFTLRDILTAYPSFIRRRDMPRMLAYYELYKLIQYMPGSIVDLGIFRGAGFFNWINLLETFAPGDRMRKVYGFDHFMGFQNFTDSKDSGKDWLEENNENGLLANADYELIESLLALHNGDSFFPGVERGKLIEGDVLETIPEFALNNLGTRLSLIYFDINMYEPTKVALDNLYDLLLPGGVIAFNGWGSLPWEGEAKAFEEFIAERGLKVKIKKFDFSTMPRGYFIKD